MTSTTTVQIRRKGVFTLPIEFRRQYNLDEGDSFSLIDLGEGAFLLTPQLSEVARLGDQIARIMAEEEVSIDELLAALDEERESFYQEHYVKTRSVY
jgi:bifunctional DNA-binding transcriptional regulator/antitoxin component of YhaV-PrlF toxin-antitoxin module